MTQPSVSLPTSLPVLPADVFRVVEGANEGDALGVAEDLSHDDLYTLDGAPETRSLMLVRQSGHYTVAAGSDVGTTGRRVHLDCTATLMDGSTHVIEVLVLAEVDVRNHLSAVYLLPLAPLQPRVRYLLVGIDTENTQQRLAERACVSFTRGTRISLSTGRQVPVEDLKVGDMILTRDDGARPLRWIGQSTQRAVGSFAPIRIAAGTLNNLGDLVVSPGHRLFIYQRSDRLGAGRSELLVKARHLVNGTSVTVENGGFVDYFQLLFDRHQIIFAEGIAAESMLVDDNTAALLDPKLVARMAAAPAGTLEIDGFDVRRALLDRPDAVNVLRQASRG